jgi:hypothetical protein
MRDHPWIKEYSDFRLAPEIMIALAHRHKQGISRIDFQVKKWILFCYKTDKKGCLKI